MTLHEVEASTPILSVSGLVKRFAGEDRSAVGGIDFDLAPGEIFALLGPSGCGKSTTLRMIAGFEKPDAGTVRLGDRDITRAAPETRGIGIVFQDYALFPHLTVLENVMFGLKALPRAKRRAKAEEWIAFVGLSEFTARMPHALSGGQQQRVALARTLASEPRLVLLDEPFSNLDAALRESTRDEMRALLKKAGVSVILVTHDQGEAFGVGDRIALMRDGLIEQIGTPEAVYQGPRTAFAAQFLGKTNLLEGQAQGRVAKTDLGWVALNEHATGRVLLSLRPEHLEVMAPEASQPTGPMAGSMDASMADMCRNCVLPAQIIGREFRGHDLSYRVAVDGRELFALTDYRVDYRPGDRVVLCPREPAVVLARLDDGDVAPRGASVVPLTVPAGGNSAPGKMSTDALVGLRCGGMIQ